MNPFVYRSLTGLALLLIALVGLFADNSYDDVFSARRVVASVMGRRLQVGSRMPSFVAYDARGRRVNPMTFPRPAAFIFYACHCSAEKVRGWVDAARSNKEFVNIFTPNAPAELGERQNMLNCSAPMYAIRLSEFQSIIGATVADLPMVVHLASDGTILGIQRR